MRGTWTVDMPYQATSPATVNTPTNTLATEVQLQYNDMTTPTTDIWISHMYQSGK